ncbi:spore germination protein [Fictibacillus barbaricus]|uniref:Stage V sporulation protein AF n=1 Tax=Fictibacillus barbaricus TaxID=182136 RepID=A0ABU1TZU0_9BACL|nr:spore germination protein [Fictibacillus barbaricus]MDR7072730.1 stage V sporulation protein AF [Fictibacillus barbaricus]
MTYLPKKQPLSPNYEENVEYLKKELGVDISFDCLHLDLEYAGRKMAIFLIDGFGKDDILHYLMNLLADIEPCQLDPDPLMKLMKTYIPYVEISKSDDLNQGIDWVLAGPTILLVEGLTEFIQIDARTYPVRGPEEPDVERVVRGARDGFVETIIFNTALTRRRVRDRSLRMEYFSIGRRSKTDVCISYIEDIVDIHIVDRIKESLKKIDTDGLPMGEKTVEEFICGRHLNPYPLVRYTERPDTAAVHLFEGHVLIYVDGSPSVLITPTTFWHHLQHAEEYRQKPIVGSYLKFVRFFAVWLSIFLLPLWYLMSTHHELLLDRLSFIGPEKVGNIPLFLQFIFIEVGMDMLRMATIHTPTSVSTGLGLVSAIVIGQVAVEVGLFVNEVVLYIAIAAIGTFATPTYELSLANRMLRLSLLTITALFGVPGYVIGLTLTVLFFVSFKSFHIPYLWPFIPFNPKAIRDVIFRIPMPLKNRRPIVLHPRDPDR